MKVGRAGERVRGRTCPDCMALPPLVLGAERLNAGRRNAVNLTGHALWCLIRESKVMFNNIQTTKCTVCVHGLTSMTSAWQRGLRVSGEREVSS